MCVRVCVCVRASVRACMSSLPKDREVPGSDQAKAVETAAVDGAVVGPEVEEEVGIRAGTVDRHGCVLRRYVYKLVCQPVFRPVFRHACRRMCRHVCINRV